MLLLRTMSSLKQLYTMAMVCILCMAAKDKEFSVVIYSYSSSSSGRANSDINSTTPTVMIHQLV